MSEPKGKPRPTAPLSGSEHPIVDPVRIMPGPLGADSPYVPADPDDLPLSRWHAWMDLVADREAGQPSPQHVIRDAVGRPPHPAWGLWWLTLHRDVDRRLLHRARVTIVLDGSEMLLAACGLSLPWVGPDPNIVPRQAVPELPESAGLVQCAPCAENDPADPAFGRREHQWQGSSRDADPS